MPRKWTQIGMYNPYCDRTVALTTTRPGLQRLVLWLGRLFFRFIVEVEVEKAMTDKPGGNV